MLPGVQAGKRYKPCSPWLRRGEIEHRPSQRTSRRKRNSGGVHFPEALRGFVTDGYTWDARNQLVSTLSGASFQYDALGRRVANTFGPTTTNYLYDGVNVVQEIQNATLTANLLGGLGVDELFTRADASGTANFLTDALGTTVALADATGTIQTQYAYEPFGNTTVSGPPNANPYQFTGRENDATGLYFYRARYYNPGFQRFVSEDPIRFNGGINLFAYVGNNPINFTDPLGLKTAARQAAEEGPAARETAAASTSDATSTS